MLEEFTIFHEGGSVLWSKRFDSGISSSKSNPLNNLISNVLLEVRSPPRACRRQRGQAQASRASDGRRSGGGAGAAVSVPRGARSRSGC